MSEPAAGLTVWYGSGVGVNSSGESDHTDSLAASYFVSGAVSTKGRQLCAQTDGLYHRSDCDSGYLSADMWSDRSQWHRWSSVKRRVLSVIVERFSVFGLPEKCCMSRLPVTGKAISENEV